MGTTMKIMLVATILPVLTVAGPSCAVVNAAEDSGIALAIIYDTSGSMKDAIKDQTGHSAPKYLIANRALLSIADRLQAFATNTATGSTRHIQTGLYVFQGEQAREAVPFGPFEAGALREWADHFNKPTGSTPLGNALTTACQRLLDSSLARKHVLVITDGVNTAGPDPARVLPKLRHQAEQRGTSLSVHFIAFDVNAAVFAPVKKLGATVVAAADGTQLNEQLESILERKILLEEEEPTPTK